MTSRRVLFARWLAWGFASGVWALVLAAFFFAAGARAQVPPASAGWELICPGPEGFVYPVSGIGTLAYCMGPQANGLTFDGATLPNAAECITAQAAIYAGQGHSCTNPGRAYFSAATVETLPAFVPADVDPPDPPASAPTGAEPLSSEAAGLVMLFGGCVVLAAFFGVGAARWLV